MLAFNQSLESGKTGETEIAQFLLSKGHKILPVYEIAEGQYKGPAVYSGDKTIIAPDMLVFHKDKGAVFIEAKSKTGFCQYRKKSTKDYVHWVTGIDAHHYSQYLDIKEQCKTDVYLMFLQKGGWAKDSPATSPSGLYCGEISVLNSRIDHRYDGNKYGKGGMVYWHIDDLKKISDYPLPTFAPTSNAMRIAK